MESNVWCVTVFKCKPSNVEDVLVGFYEFVKGIQGVADLHFLIRDRVDDEVVFSFRVLVESKDKEVVKSKIAYKLATFMPEEKFAIDPSIDNSLQKYVAWDDSERVTKHGQEKLEVFCSLLNQLSNIVIDMAKKGYFDSNERVEIAHAMSWILGCTEYGKSTTGYMEVGYYDRMRDKYHPYLKQGFSK